MLPVVTSISRRKFLAGGMMVAAGSVLGLRHKVKGAEGPETATRTFQESGDIFPNPERGFYAQRRSDRMERLDSLRTQAISLLLVTLDLREFRTKDLTAEKLAELQSALGVARAQGFKVIFRAAYGFTGQDYRV